jgi:hypothetical protein
MRVPRSLLSVLLFWCFLCEVSYTPAHARVARASVVGDYETARTPDDERVQLKLQAGGKAQIVAEHNFQIPGDAAKRRGRSTTYAKWVQRGSVVTVSYARIKDQLRFDGKTSLTSIGLTGAAPALSPIKPVNPKSRLRGAILWKAPHNYKMKEASAERPSSADDADHRSPTPR